MPRRLNAAASSSEWRKRISPSPFQFSSMTIGAISLVESTSVWMRHCSRLRMNSTMPWKIGRVNEAHDGTRIPTTGIPFLPETSSLDLRAIALAKRITP